MPGKEPTGGQSDAALRPHVHCGSQAHCCSPHDPLFAAEKGHCCSQPWDGPRVRVISMAALLAVTVLLGLAGGAFATYRWSQTKYYIGDDNGEVAIFQGVPTSLFGFQLSHAVTDTHMKTSELPPSWQEQLAQGISFDTYGEAKTHTRLIKKQLKQQQDEAAQKEQDKANGESDNKSSGTTSDKSSGKSDKSDDASANKSGGDQS